MVRQYAAMAENTERVFREAFESADIKVNGERPWDIRVHDFSFYDRVLRGGSLAFGEAYMDQMWDVESLDQLMYRVLKNKLQDHVRINLPLAWRYVRAKLFNMQREQAYTVGERHYDIGNDLYEAMLDK